MDPLSISTGVITILQATTAIISVCYDFRAALKNEPWSLTTIINELKALRNILESLEVAIEFDRPQSWDKSQMLILLSNRENGALAICQQELQILQKKIGSSNYAETNGSKRKAVLQALRWQLREKDARECLGRIERCKSTLSLALHGDQAALLGKIRASTTSIQATVENIDYKVTVVGDTIRAKEIDEEYKAMMQWLSPVDPHENHEAAISIHHEGTGAWFLESDEFLEWYRAKGSFLWLSGFPGSGKTILFSQIVAHLINDRFNSINGVGIAYFYFDFARREFRATNNAIGSLVAQLCSQFPYPEELVVAYKRSQTPGKIRCPTWDTLGNALSWFTRDRKILILLDALDECENREEILTFLSDLGKTDDGISVLVSSRNELDIENAFHSFPRLQVENRRVEMDRDIQSYLDQRLATDNNLKKLTPAIKSDIKLSLIEKSAGMFRWAQCQLDALSRLRTIKSIRMSLNSLPRTINETYANILRKVQEDDVELLRRALCWVVFSVLPLTIEELQEAIAIESGICTHSELAESRVSDPKDIIGLGGSLFSISKTGHVKLAHLSVKDYLLSADIKENSDVSQFAMKSEEVNEELAINSITYLSLDSLASGPVDSKEAWEDRLSRHPLIRHAAKGWTYYLRATSSTTALKELVSNFFATKSRGTFMSWIQILNSNWIFKWTDYPRHATELYYAASFGLNDIVRTLIRNGVELDAPGSRFGGTALHGATLREHIPIMRHLLEAGANPSRADFNRISPLHTAARIGNAEVIKLLLKFGASKTAEDSLGETPYDWAMQAGQSVSQILLRGEDVQLSDESRRTTHKVYQRTAAFFPAMAIAQGLKVPLPVEKL